ncbi:MAG: LD-carboxypeptidase [Muribaculaceae bacterium]|nr:LD-carboxypeptidase [Muribaculaceae bacterium]
MSTDNQQFIYPKPLKRGDTVVFISPASRVKAEFVHQAADKIQAAGFNVRIMPHALGEPCGSYSSSSYHRLQDFKEAWADPEVGAIICTRGGYGAVHWIDEVSDEFLRATPKWVVGFSDVSAIHARLLKAGIVSLHGSMARYISEEESALDQLLAILCAEHPEMNYRFEADPNYPVPAKEARGRLKGGNLAVLSHLIATPYDIFNGEGDILFIEDISEAIYATERMLWQLHLSGALKHAAGLIVGTFTDTRADANYPDTISMIYDRLRQWGYLDRVPVAFNMPIGHIPQNIPLIEGALVELRCNNNTSILKTV